MKGTQVNAKQVLSLLFITLAMSATGGQSKSLSPGRRNPSRFKDVMGLACRSLISNTLQSKTAKALAAVRNHYNTSAKSCDAWDYKSIILLTQFHLKIRMENATNSELLGYYRTLFRALNKQLKKRRLADAVVKKDIREVKKALRNPSRLISMAIKQGRDEGVLLRPNSTGRVRIPTTNPPTDADHVACVLSDVQVAARHIKIGACKIWKGV